MGDRVSSVTINGFILSVDRDHKGRFRGDQAMSDLYRGWHYHVEHPRLCQNDIFNYLSAVLLKMGAKQIKIGTEEDEEEIYVGTAEKTPARAELWRLNEASTVLWISAVTGGLHIEANKREEYAKNILSKPLLIKLLKEVH